MHYIKDFLSLCTIREDCLTVSLPHLIDSYAYWIKRCYLGSYTTIPTRSSWTRTLHKIGINTQGDEVIGCYLMDCEDWEYVSRLPKSCYLYLIKNLTNNYVKIGVSSNPRRRLSQLQTGNDSKLDLLGIIKVEEVFQIEKILHKHFASSRIHGEWFSLSSEDLGLLSSYFLEGK